MIKRAVKSFGHAREGLVHALRRERNLQLYVCCFAALVLASASLFVLATWEWCVLFLAGGMFIAVELLNTALERLTDVVDELRGGSANGYHAALKATKDVAAAASLIAFGTSVFVILLVLLPHVLAMGK